ncbi:MAG: PsbP-related protein [Candidatus Paceibacterota bacterium]|jgi:hypothetical protein
MENKSKLNTILLVIIIILLVVGLGYFFLNNSKQKEKNTLVNNLPQTSIPTTTQTLDKTADWATCTNTMNGYSIKYPSNKGWVSENNCAIFGILLDKNESGYYAKKGGYMWEVSVGYKEAELPQILKTTASEIDGKEIKEDININGMSALLVTFTPNKEPYNWASKMVYIKRNGALYIISNDAQETSDFEAFYNSFRFTK